MASDDIPFPLLAGQYIAVHVNNEIEYYKIAGQPAMFDLTYPYEIGPGQKIADQSLTLSNGSAFRTNQLKEWVTWIDNDYLTVSWTINSNRINSLNSITVPLTKNLSPYGSINFPLFIFNNPAGNVSFTLGNSSQTNVISGTLHIIMYDYRITKVSTIPQQYTDIDYRRGEE